MPTTSPVPSVAPEDFDFNVRRIDEVVNSTSATFTDRFGAVRKTIAGVMTPLQDAATEAIDTDIPALVGDVQTARNTAVNTTIPALVAQVDEAVAETYVGQAVASANAAQTSRIAAESARDAAFVNADVYASTAVAQADSGLLAGDQYQVLSADGLTIFRYTKDSGSASTLVASYPSAAGAMALRVRSEEEAAIAARIDTVRHSKVGQRPTGAKISWRVHPRDLTPPAHWAWDGHSTGRRFAWAENGDLYEVPAGVLRHTYESRFLGGHGRYLGAWINEPYSQNKSTAATLAGGAAGSPGTLPTGVAEVSGSAGLTRTITKGTEAGVSYVQLRYVGTASAATFDIDFGAAVSAYLNSSDASTAVAAGQNWTFSAYAKLIGAATGLTSAFPYVKQDSGALSLGTRTIPLLDVYHAWFAVRALTSGAAAVNGGIRFSVTNGAAVDFTVRIILPQLEPRAGMTSPIPVVDGQRYVETASLPRNSSAFLDRWGTSKKATLFTEFIRPHWDFGAGRVSQISDTTGGGRLSIGEGADNALGVYGVNWSGSASVTIGTHNTYHDLPGSITRIAGSASATAVIGCRDNFETMSAAGEVFSGTQPAGIFVGWAATPRGMIFREIAAWDYAMDATALRAITQNFENATYIDKFERSNSVVGALGATESGSLPWLSYGYNPTYSEPGRPAYVKGGELSVDFNDPAGGAVTIATYNRLALPNLVNRMGAAIVWRDIPGRTVEIASIALISTTDSRERIAAITGAEGGPGSVHNVWLINSLDAGVFTGGTTETDEFTSYTKRAYGAIAWVGQVFWGGRTFLQIPDGRLIEPTESATMWAKRGQYCTWEHFRSGIAGAVSNEVQILAAIAD